MEIKIRIGKYQVGFTYSAVAVFLHCFIFVTFLTGTCYAVGSVVSFQDSIVIAIKELGVIVGCVVAHFVFFRLFELDKQFQILDNIFNGGAKNEIEKKSD